MKYSDVLTIFVLITACVALGPQLASSDGRSST